MTQALESPRGRRLRPQEDEDRLTGGGRGPSSWGRRGNTQGSRQSLAGPPTRTCPFLQACPQWPSTPATVTITKGSVPPLPLRHQGPPRLPQPSPGSHTPRTVSDCMLTFVLPVWSEGSRKQKSCFLIFWYVIGLPSTLCTVQVQNTFIKWTDDWIDNFYIKDWQSKWASQQWLCIGT